MVCDTGTTFGDFMPPHTNAAALSHIYPPSLTPRIA
jgi:hypothetical protein